MGQLVEIISSVHKSTNRNYLERMINRKVECSDVARMYGQDYWDGDRCYGYGGYKYDGRWNSIARAMIKMYDLGPDSRILDVGCGKAYLLYEFKKILPDCEVLGIDISEYAINSAMDEVKPYLRIQNAQDEYSFEDNYFDFVVSITTLHNLFINELKSALLEIERVGKNKYLVVESYRNTTELFNLQCWALTCESFFSAKEWEWLFGEYGYSGDYEFIYFE